MNFNGVKITQETILATRQHFADLCNTCIINAVEYGTIPKDQLPPEKFFVNDLLRYMVQENQKAEDFLAGKNDNSFTFWQRAYWLQTGECIGLFSKG